MLSFTLLFRPIWIGRTLSVLFNQDLQHEISQGVGSHVIFLYCPPSPITIWGKFTYVLTKKTPRHLKKYNGAI